MRILHAIHDFLPPHQAGSEICAFELSRALVERRHHVTVLSAEFDPSRRHSELTWRVQDDIPVIEPVNDWVCDSFVDSYLSARITGQIGHVLDAVQPKAVHVHSLLNLSFDLPALARERGAVAELRMTGRTCLTRDIARVADGTVLHNARKRWNRTFSEWLVGRFGISS